MNTLPGYHRHKLGLVGSSFCLVTTFSSASLADNPIVQTLYTADPAPMVHDGTLYVYTTHDEDVIVDDFFTMNDWRVYSSTDAVNWTDHGSPLAYTNGQFYFYVPMRIGGVSRIGVAVSDSPTGPFADPLGRPLVESDCGDIDPTVFIDDDEQAYLYWGNPDLCYVALNEDMISYGCRSCFLRGRSMGSRLSRLSWQRDLAALREVCDEVAPLVAEEDAA
jgi:arabinoxylan arabinofuranohydrolase